MADLNITQLNDRFETLPAEAVLAWAWETFGPEAVASSSFQTQSLPLLHLIGRVCSPMPVLFVDTGFHFPETLAFRDELQARYGLNIVTVRPLVDQSEQVRRYGAGLYHHDPDLCCYINKVEPMQWALKGMKAWISGVRRDQTDHRRTLRVLEPQPDGLLKIHPLLNWTGRQVWAYIHAHDLPTHPLLAQGYLSIGCAPCTRPVMDGEDERSGRWAGTDKAECGLHLTAQEMPVPPGGTTKE